MIEGNDMPSKQTKQQAIQQALCGQKRILITEDLIKVAAHRLGLEKQLTPQQHQQCVRDSWVNTVYLDFRYIKFANINVRNAFLWTRNSMAEIQLEGEEIGLLQPEDVRSRFILINNIDKTWTYNSLAVSTKFKHRLIYENVESEEDPRTSASDFIPILMSEYSLTPKTRFVLAAQGMPFLPSKHWERVHKDETYSQTDYAFMYKMRSEYFGFENDFFFGYLLTDREHTRLKDRDFKRGTFFVEVITPF